MRNAIRLFAPIKSVPPHAGLLHHLILLLLLLPMGVGVGTATAHAQTRAYVTNLNKVSVIDTATNTVVATIPVGVGPIGVAITPDGTGAYVTNLFSNTVSVIDIATNTVVATIPVGQAPSRVAITPDVNNNDNDNNHKDKRG
jgi:YVTN family beta-propeller protein